MYNKLQELYPNFLIKEGPLGSFVRESGLKTQKWVFAGKTSFDKFVKRYLIESAEDAKFIVASRADERDYQAHNKYAGKVNMTVPVINNEYLLIQEEARPIDLFERGEDASVLAFPAGILRDEFENETALEGAMREMKEETGLLVEDITSLNSEPMYSTPGLTDEATYFFKADINELKSVAEAKTDGVTRAWWYVPISNFYKWLGEMEKLGKNATAQTRSALSLLQQKTDIKL